MGRERRSGLSAVSPRDDKLGNFFQWEFVLKNSSDLSIIKNMIKAVPIPDDVPRLKQMILIRELTFLLSKDLDVKKALNVLEALHHTFEDPHQHEDTDSDDMVLSKRFKLSKSVTDRSLINQRGNEKLVGDGLRQPLLKLKVKLRKWLNGDADAPNIKTIESKLSELVKTTWALLGPAYLEEAVAAVISGNYKPQGVTTYLPVAENNNAGTVDDSGIKSRDEDERGVDRGKDVNGRNQDMDHVERGKDVNGRNQDMDHVERGKDVNGRNQDMDHVERGKDVNGRNQDMNQTRQELADGLVELNKVVKDPLPSLLRKPDAAGASGVVRRNLMERHPSAQAQVWAESDDDFQDSPTHLTNSSASRQVRLPALRSPTRARGVSPVAVQAGSKPRRPMNKWTEEEVEVLKRGVSECGKGRWKMILQKNSEVFQYRTEVDLKDKWRNLERYDRV